MSALNHSAPSQPEQQTSYFQQENPASKTADESNAHNPWAENSTSTDHRSPGDVPSAHDADAHPSALGHGDQGPLKEKDIPASDAQNYSKDDSNLEGEQMRAPGEGEVAQAVRSGGGGGHGEERSLTAQIDRKAEEHEAELHRRGERTGKEIEEEYSEDWTGKRADIGRALERDAGNAEAPKVILQESNAV